MAGRGEQQGWDGFENRRRHGNRGRDLLHRQRRQDHGHLRFRRGPWPSDGSLPLNLAFRMALRKGALSRRLRMAPLSGVRACLLAGIMLAAPSRGAAPEGIAPLRAPGKAEGRIHSYQDDANLYVTTVAGLLEHPISSLFSLRI